MRTPEGDRGAIIDRGGRALIIWGPTVPGGMRTADGTPMSVTVFRGDITESLVVTIMGNLRWSDPGFPVTVID